MSAAHTPGPWLIRQGDEWTKDIVTHDGCASQGEPMYWNVASCNKQRDECDANLLLIAAAPELLEAAQAAWNCIAELSPTQARVETAQMLQAAIAKATGSTT